MFVTVTDNHVLVRLSRRNLRQLHDILEGHDVRSTYLARKDESGKALVVQIEEDADHYERRDPGPGLGLGRFVSQAAPRRAARRRR